MQPEAYRIFEVVAVGTVLILLVSGFMVWFVVAHRKRRNEFIREKKRMEVEFERQLLQSQVEVQENTLSNLGKELHDNIGQLLSTTKMLLGLTERHLAAIPDTFHTATNTLGKAIGELRMLTKSLDKEWLEQFQLIENIQTEFSRINATDTLKAVCQCPESVELENEEQIILFRIIQEGVQNAIKHSGASTILLNVMKDQEGLTIYLSDNGKGFDLSLPANGVGLMNMKTRTRLLGGTIEWSSKADGTSIMIRIPYKELYENTYRVGR
jgi:signal transduction histidine kinase